MTAAAASHQQGMSLAAAISASLAAFVWGIFGCLPIIGLIPALYALVCGNRVRVHFGAQWNPASQYLAAGVALAVVGLLGTLAVVFSVVAVVYLS